MSAKRQHIKTNEDITVNHKKEDVDILFIWTTRFNGDSTMDIERQ